MNHSSKLPEAELSLVSKSVARFASQDEEVVGQSDTAAVAVEEPLEVRVNGETYAVTMRTPGRDRALVAGYLLSEGLLTDRDQIGSLAHCYSQGQGRRNIMDFVPAAGLVIDIESGRRQNFTSSACSVCGRAGIDDLLQRVGRNPHAKVTTSAKELLDARRQLSAYGTFEHSGGVHGAAVLGPEGTIAYASEDVGRHNAVDKAIGAALLAGELPLSEHLLLVTSRASFEIVQKAAIAGLAGVACFSAPTSLAIETADIAGLTLVGFLRDSGCNLYTGSLLDASSEVAEVNEG